MEKETRYWEILFWGMILLASFGPLQTGKYNAVADIGTSLPKFWDLPATDETTLSSGNIKTSILVLGWPITAPGKKAWKEI